MGFAEPFDSTVMSRFLDRLADHVDRKIHLVVNQPLGPPVPHLVLPTCPVPSEGPQVHLRHRVVARPSCLKWQVSGVARPCFGVLVVVVGGSLCCRSSGGVVLSMSSPSSGYRRKARPSTSACASATPASGWWPRRTRDHGGVADPAQHRCRRRRPDARPGGGAGRSVRGGPNDMPWGQRVAHIQDPDGNPVNLTQPIPAR